MKCIYPYHLPEIGVDVPCGKCIQCRIQKRKEWAMRCYHELDSWDKSIFVTLTYKDLPPNGSISKKDLQKFFKRLRKSLGDRKIRYYASGEYGDRTHRPHYHIIIFGLDFDDVDIIRNAWPYCDWQALGMKPFGLVEQKSIEYVARYIDKKYYGQLADEIYLLHGLEVPFQLCSLGLGREYVDKNADRLREDQITTVRGQIYSLPRYYLNRLNIMPDERKQQAYFTECETVAHYTGLYCSVAEFRRHFKPNDSIALMKAIRDAKNQHERNLKARISIKQRKL